MKKRFQQILSCAVALLLLPMSSLISIADNSVNPVPIAPIQEVTSFTDVPETHYAYQAILKMNQLGVITGYGDGSFKPDAPVKRVEFAVMMVKALQLKMTNQNTSSFIDMTSEKWAIPYVETAKPYLTGYKTTAGILFKPLESAVREDMAVSLVKALDYKVNSEETLVSYADFSQVSKELRPYVAAAIDNGLMVGSTVAERQYFNPKNSLTRAESAQLLMNVIQEEKITFSGNEAGDNKIVLDVKKDNNTIAKEKEKEKIKPTQPNTTMGTLLKAEKSKDGSYILKWTPGMQKGFQGYKVVASLTDSTPQYPENGYKDFITDLSKTTMVLQTGDAYNNGDFEKFKEGKTYYVSITYLYDSGKRYSNVLKITF